MRCNPLINEHFVIKRLIGKNRALSRDLRLARERGTTSGDTTPYLEYTFKVCIDHDEKNIIDTGISGPLMYNWEIDNDTMEMIIEAVKDKGLKYIEYAVSRARIIDDSVILIGLTKLSGFAKTTLEYTDTYEANKMYISSANISADSIYTAPVMAVINLTGHYKLTPVQPRYTGDKRAVSLNDNIDIRYWKEVPKISGSGTTRHVANDPLYDTWCLEELPETKNYDVINLSYATDFNWCFYASNQPHVLLYIYGSSTIDTLILNGDLKNKYPYSNKELYFGSTTEYGYTAPSNITINNLHSSQEIYDLLKNNNNITIHNFTKVGGD